MTEFSADAAPLSNVTWYWVREVKVTVWYVVIETEEVVTVPAVATFVAVPLSTFQDATL